MEERAAEQRQLDSLNALADIDINEITDLVDRMDDVESRIDDLEDRIGDVESELEDIDDFGDFEHQLDELEIGLMIWNMRLTGWKIPGDLEDRIESRRIRNCLPCLNRNL